MRKCNGGGCPYKSDSRCCIDCSDRKTNECDAVCNIVKYSKPFDCDELDIEEVGA